MPKLEDIDAPGVLGITEQQLNLLKTVYKLTSKNKVATPRDIELTYSKDHHGGIQKSNLFRQLKILQDKSFIKRQGEANYQLNFDGIKKTLDTRKQEYNQTLQHYEQLTDELEEYFKKMTTTPERPVVEYLSYMEVFDRITGLLENSKSYYTVSKFPNITYDYNLVQKLGIERYIETLWHTCLRDKTLSVTYLSNLSIDYPYDKFMKVHKKHDIAIRECEIIIDNLENLVTLHNNLKVMYIDFPYGMDILLTEGDILRDYFIFIRDERQMAIGGVYIRSPETAKRAKDEFLRNCKIATDIAGPEKKEIFKKLRKDLTLLDKKKEASSE